MAPPPVAQACPSCSAAVRRGAPWCTQCYADLHPVRETPDALARPLDVPVSRAEPAAPARWPCTACGTDNDLRAGACASCGAGFLATVHEEQVPTLVLPLVGDLARLRQGQRVGVALGVVLAVLLLSVLLVALVT